MKLENAEKSLLGNSINIKSNNSQSFSRYIIYPLVMLSVVFFYYSLIKLNVNHYVANYIPIIFGIGLLSVLEWKNTFDDSWYPSKNDILTDSLYTLFVQILLPELLTLGLVLFVISHWGNELALSESLWPHEWPLLAQIVLMILIADFIRYWMHRWAHNNNVLWRLHAVHHSVTKLYWLNASRFHPLEKIIHYSHDSFIFILLAVDIKVMGGYFVFMAVNAYFLHSNIKFNYGPLAYVFNTAHAHRWHHSIVVTESNHNYGNILIIWDRIFNTYYMPKEKTVGDIGINDNSYPENFFSQLIQPIKYTSNR